MSNNIDIGKLLNRIQTLEEQVRILQSFLCNPDNDLLELVVQLQQVKEFNQDSKNLKEKLKKEFETELEEKLGERLEERRKEIEALEARRLEQEDQEKFKEPRRRAFLQASLTLFILFALSLSFVLLGKFDLAEKTQTEITFDAGTILLGIAASVATAFYGINSRRRE
ncbi:MAG: hypothetical protein WBA57_09100 [Elainellaceae cyanobacterium]